MVYRFNILKSDYDNAGSVSSQVKELIKDMNIDKRIIRRISIACYEAEINMVIHSLGGEILLDIEDDKLRLVFKDLGPGILDLDLALTPGFSTANNRARSLGFGAGMGLVNIKRVCDYFEINSNSNGTILKIGFNL